MPITKSDLRATWADLRSGPRGWLRSTVKAPIVAGAARRMGALPRAELTSLIPASTYSVRLTELAGRHGWSFGAAEQLVLQMLIEARRVKRAFEIGTFNGATSALIAEALPEDGEVVTVDLPDEAFTASQHPETFTAADVGWVHRQSPAAQKVTQVRADSLALDTAPWHAWADLVLVDGAHDYEHGYSDTRTALRVVAPGGIIVWDDFDAYWHGLVNGILDATPGMPVVRLAGLPLAALER